MRQLARRSLLKGFAATLLAAAVRPGTVLALSESDAARLARLLANGGVVEHQHFVFYNGETIAPVGKVRLHACSFRWIDVLPNGALDLGRVAPGSSITSCSFTGLRSPPDAVRPHAPDWLQLSLARVDGDFRTFTVGAAGYSPPAR